MTRNTSHLNVCINLRFRALHNFFNYTTKNQLIRRVGSFSSILWVLSLEPHK